MDNQDDLKSITDNNQFDHADVFFESDKKETGGALPSLDDGILGVPEAQKKSKTNINKFALLGIALVGLLFVIAGLLIYQRTKSTTDDTQIASLNQGSGSNTEVSSDSIAARKARLKKEQDDEEARLKALEEEAARRAAEEAARLAAMNQRQPVTPDGKPKPTEQTPLERKLSGSVLLGNTGSKITTELSEEEAQQKEVNARLASMGIESGGKPPPQDGFLNAGSRGGSQSSSNPLSASLNPTKLSPTIAGALPNADFLLKKGTTIPCAMLTGIDTTLPGFVICKTLNDVYSANGKTLLVERGATVFGEQQSKLEQGQHRTFILWTRIDNPSGVFANIDSPASDAMGYSGIRGRVKTYFWKRFGSAIMLSLIQDFSEAYSQRISRSSNSNAQTTENAQQAAEDMASEALRSSINIPPTLVVKPATIVNVLVARDVSFESVYGLIQ